MLFQRISLYTGKLASWLLFLMMFTCCIIVLLRYGFHIGSTALQDVLLYLHGSAFLLGAAYTLQCNEHVRVDILYRHFSPQQKAWVDAAGTIFFLLPFCAFLMWFGWQFFHTAWVFKEGSAEPGGLPYVYLLKGIIPLSFALLGLQALCLLFQTAQQLIFSREH